MNRWGRLAIEIILLVLVSGAAGVLIGTLAYFVSFGVWGFGFAAEQLYLAYFDGGIAGGALGVLAGLVAYYAVLKRQVTLKRIAVIVGGSLLGGCILAIINAWLSDILTPMLAIGITFWTRDHVAAQGNSRIIDSSN